MRILRPTDYRVMPWKNGGGSTTEIAIGPAGASVAAGFDWRVSMADVTSDGPFSAFDGYDRQLAILEGDGMVLTGLPEGDIALRPGDAPLAFPGDAHVRARLIGGPVRDFNLMTRRAACRGQIESTTIEASFTLFCRGLATLAHVVEGQLAIGGTTMAAGDTVFLEAGEQAGLDVLAPYRARLLVARVLP